MAQTGQLGRTATTVRTENGMTVVTYHSTAVVKFNASKVTLDSGGWRTATTKSRMNQAANQFGLGFAVFQRDREWYVGLPDNRIVDFADGMTFSRG